MNKNIKQRKLLIIEKVPITDELEERCDEADYVFLKKKKGYITVKNRHFPKLNQYYESIEELEFRENCKIQLI